MNTRTLLGLVGAALASASVMLAHANQATGQAQGQGGQPRRGQASDEENRGKVEQVRAGQEGFATIFDGTSIKGWTISAKSRHSRTSDNKTAGHWEIRDGVLVASQDTPGNGGLFITDRKYSDFEVVLDMRNDFGLDSGLYLRSTEDGTAYQVMIDYRTNGSVAGVYGENMKPGFNVAAFHFFDAPDRIMTEGEASPMPVLPAAWPMFWKHGQWNEIRARIVGNPATVTTWINGVKFIDWTDTIPRLADGYLALQVHGGLEFVQGSAFRSADGARAGDTDYTKRDVRYRNVRIKTLR
jgi:hypothetical protein